MFLQAPSKLENWLAGFPADSRTGTTTPIHQIASGTNHDDDCADIDDVYLHARLDALVVSAADAVPGLLRHQAVVRPRPAPEGLSLRPSSA